MNASILDSDTMSEILKRKNPTALRRALEYSQSFPVFTLAAVTVHEIVYGLERKAAFRQLQEARDVFEANEVIVPRIEDLSGPALFGRRQSGKADSCPSTTALSARSTSGSAFRSSRATRPTSRR